MSFDIIVYRKSAPARFWLPDAERHCSQPAPMSCVSPAADGSVRMLCAVLRLLTLILSDTHDCACCSDVMPDNRTVRTTTCITSHSIT